MSVSSKKAAAKKLAQLHFEVEPDLKQVFLIGPIRGEDPREPIKLLEVVEGAIESGVEPISFASDHRNGIDYPSVIVELSPLEFTRLKSGEITFGNRGWELLEELHVGVH